MSVQPPRLLEVRQIFRERTGLPPTSLGIIHYVDKDGKYRGGGGYHAGNDLLAMIGRLHTDYSKRQSSRDRPGTNYGSAIDIGRFRVKLPNGRVVTNHDMTRWVLAEIKASAPDTKWIREIIYSLDDRTVQRYDALGIITGGDKSHTSHEHYSVFRSDIDSPLIPGLFRRFWSAMEGKVQPAPQPQPQAPIDEEEDDMVKFYFFTAASGSLPARWGFGFIHEDGSRSWLEADNEPAAIGYALGVKLAPSPLTQDAYAEEKAKFLPEV